MQIRGKNYIDLTLREHKVEYEKEFRFHPVRLFRFDFYFEFGGKKIGIEYDGLFASKSRHTTVTGFSRDIEKSNIAQLSGYIMLRYTAMNYKNFYNDLRQVLGLEVKPRQKAVRKKINKGH